LELHAEKTRLIEFGRFAARDRKQRGEGKPETFTFLGFTHYCGKRRSNGTFIVWRETAKKRLVAWAITNTMLSRVTLITLGSSCIGCEGCGAAF
jgi:hypothetical protein